METRIKEKRILKPYGSIIKPEEVQYIFQKFLRAGNLLVLEDNKGGHYRYTPVRVIFIQETLKKKIYIQAPFINTTKEFHINGIEIIPRGNHTRRLLPPFPDIWQASIKGQTWRHGETDYILFKTDDQDLLRLRKEMRKQKPWIISNKYPLYNTYQKLITCLNSLHIQTRAQKDKHTCST